jgi:tetratricopeptide (TPR) repeat protein
LGEIKSAIEIFKLNLLAYTDSADANDNLAGAYLADGQKDLARQYAERALALLNSHKLPHRRGPIQNRGVMKSGGVRCKRRRGEQGIRSLIGRYAPLIQESPDFSYRGLVHRETQKDSDASSWLV